MSYQFTKIGYLSLGLIQNSKVTFSQYSNVTYLGCVLHECGGAGESETMQVSTEIVSTKVKFLHRKTRFLLKDVRRLFCNILI